MKITIKNYKKKIIILYWVMYKQIMQRNKQIFLLKEVIYVVSKFKKKIQKKYILISKFDEKQFIR